MKMRSIHLHAMTWIALPLILAGASVTGCASSGERPDGGHGGGGPRGHAPNLFISPAGKPYRAGPDQPYPVATWFAEADKDRDGRLTLAEFQADASAFFDELDTNHDGIVDGFEVQRYEREVAPEINPQVDRLKFGEGMDLGLGERGEGGPRIGEGPKGSRRGPEAGDRRPEGAGLFGLLNEPEPVAAADTAFNSRITREEFLAVADTRFEALDKKHLGYLTLDALPKTPIQIVLQRLAVRRAKADRDRK
jgi:hypothetical protein